MGKSTPDVPTAQVVPSAAVGTPNPSTDSPMANTRDAEFMALALAEAKLAWGRTSPNPMVGSVIVVDGQVVARGHHKAAGLDHGEVAAIKDARRRGIPTEGATLYVNLEPCSFVGRTPPCTRACIEAGFSRVVAGTIDPHPKVSGRGLQTLQEAGIAVTCGVLEPECRALNAPFFTRIEKGRPHVTVKVAMSLDGKIATHTGESFPLTGEPARQIVHKLRDRMDAVLVGRRTVSEDDPRLTCRLRQELAGPGGPRDPQRIVLDPHLTLDLHHRVLQPNDSSASTWLVASSDADGPPRHLQALDAAGVEVIRCAESAEGLDILGLLAELARREVGSVLLEGGGHTIARFVEAGVVDVWIAHIAPCLIGGVSAVTPLSGLGVADLADRIGAQIVSIRRLGEDIEVVATLGGDVYGLD